MWQLFNYLVGNQTLQFLNQGIVRALQEYQQQLIKHKVTIFVRRGGPNYQEGLRVMREVGKIYCIFLKNYLFKYTQVIVENCGHCFCKLFWNVSSNVCVIAAMFF